MWAATMTRRRRRRALVVAVACAAATAGAAADARAAVEIEGFAGAAATGATIPEPTVPPGQRLTTCERGDALMVIFTYRGLQPGDTVRVEWLRDGAPYFQGADLAVGGTDGRASRAISPGVPNDAFTVHVLMNGVVEATASVVKACGEAPGAYGDPQPPPAPPPAASAAPRVGGRYRLTRTPSGRGPATSRVTRLTPLCARGACDAKLVVGSRAVRVRRDGDRYRVVVANAGTADCVSARGEVRARRGYRLQTTIAWQVVGRRYVGGTLVATQLRGRWSQARIPNARGRAAACRAGTRTWRLDAYRVGA
jgi:hypothetical protein